MDCRTAVNADVIFLTEYKIAQKKHVLIARSVKTLRVPDYKQTFEGVRLVSKVILQADRKIHERRAEVNDRQRKITSLEI